MLGSIDANAGDLLLGWDTDQFNTDVKELTLAMVSILRRAASAPAASTSTPSCAALDRSRRTCFYAHIGGMDAYALAFKLAREFSRTASSTAFVADRYASFDTGYGQEIEKAKIGFKRAGETRARQTRRTEAASAAGRSIWRIC